MENLLSQKLPVGGYSSSGPYIFFFYLGGAMSLAEVENMAALQFLTLGESGAMLPQEILAIYVFRGAFWGIQRSTESFLRRGSSS